MKAKCDWKRKWTVKRIHCVPSRGAPQHTTESAPPFLLWVVQIPSVLRSQCQISDINICDDIMGSIPKVCEVKLGAEGSRLLA